jgi:hypothetical protein
MNLTVKAWNRQAADQSVWALTVTPGYCKRHAKGTLDGRRFHLDHLVLCFQWDTRGTAPRVSTSTWELVVVGIRLDTCEELIDSVGADNGARDSSTNARNSSWINVNE